MRRIWAYLLVLIFGFSPAAPALFADDSSNVPACCRRMGVHHCVSQLPEGLAVKGVCDRYGPLSTTLAQPEYPKAAILEASRAIFAGLTRPPAAAEQTQTLHHASFSRYRQKRGPPRRFL